MSSKRLIETDLIRQLFLPLSEGYDGALGLSDDAALISDRPGHEIVITSDCLVAGVHFLPDTPPDAVAARSLRSNLSDLAAMGAAPHIYTMAISIPSDLDRAWIEQFTAQLGRDQRAYDIVLAGGDTVSTPGPLNISITALGHVPVGVALRRNGAKPGDAIFVTGTIGDAALGLRVLTGELTTAHKVDRDQLVDRFHFPAARVKNGIALRAKATACADISDGLLRDLGNICTASKCSAEIEWERVPLSPAVRNSLAQNSLYQGIVLTGGDDYELVFTGPSALVGDFTRIGTIKINETEKPVVDVHQNGAVIEISDANGYQHEW